jgi:hypothetical protein
MYELINVLNDLVSNQNKFFNQRIQEFGEHRISNYLIKKLENNNFKRIGEVNTKVWSSKVEECIKNIPNFKKIQELVLEKGNNKPIKNCTKIKKSFVYQPFGSQKYPDFLIFLDKFILPVEIKTISNEKVMSPKFNDVPPMLNGIYLAIHYGTKVLFIFKGSEYSTQKSFEAREILKEAIDKACQKINIPLENNKDILRFRARIISCFEKGTKFFKREDKEELNKATLNYIKKYY